MSALSPEPPSPSAPALGLLREPDFARLWTAETISQLGTQVSALAIPFVAIEILQASTFQVALLNVVDFLPFLLIGLPAGVWVDRLRRRPVMIAGDLGRAVALATIPVAFVPRRPDDRPAVRRRLRRRRAHRLLRRRLPELPAVGRGARPAPGGQRQAGDQPRGRRRSSVPGSAGVLIGDPAGAARGRARRALVPRVGALPGLDPAAGAGARGATATDGQPGPGDAPRDGGGAALRRSATRTSRTSRPARRPRTSSAPSPRRSSSSSRFASWG